MSDEGNDLLHDFEAWAKLFTDRVSPAARRQLTRRLVQELRRRQQQRMAAQQDPSGAAWEPRRLRARKGAIKRRAAMYAKIRTARHLKTVATPDAALLKFTGRDAWIARVAQYGLIDKVSPNGPSVRYPKRELLGFSASDRAWLQDWLIENLLPDG